MKNHHTARSAFLLALALSLPATPAVALDAPRASAADHRVRYATYDPANVIQLNAVIGVATHIVLEPGEKYLYHVFGDSQAYAFTYKDNHLFFKPIAEDADTNLIVVTDRRDYSFRISYNKDRGAAALYKLVIRYPDSEAKAEAGKARQKAIKAAFQAVGTPVNWKAYTRSGSAAIAPVHAWDDGRQTWMQFAPEADIPTVYRVTPDGQEVITNYHMADSRTMVLHRTSALWHLRLGNQVLAIQNAAFGETPPPAHTGTASAAVQRTVKGAEPQTLPPAATQAVAPPAQAAQPEPVPPVANPQPLAAAAPAVPVNANAVGDTRLMPRRMWEQAGNTWMQFDGPAPSIYSLDTNGSEVAAAITQHPKGTLELKGVASSWLLRDGPASLTIRKRTAE